MSGFGFTTDDFWAPSGGARTVQSLGNREHQIGFGGGHGPAETTEQAEDVLFAHPGLDEQPSGAPRTARPAGPKPADGLSVTWMWSAVFVVSHRRFSSPLPFWKGHA